MRTGNPERATSSPPLSTAELEVLRLRAQGLELKEIAHRRGRSVHTVRMQMDAIIEKLGARNSVHAVTLAFQKGILRCSPDFE